MLLHTVLCDTLSPPTCNPYLWDNPSVSPFPGWNQAWRIWLSSISSVLSRKTQLALCSSLSIKICALFLPHPVLLSVFFTESYSTLKLSTLCSFPPFCAFPPPYSTLLIFKSHMLPARLAQLHPANEGLFIGLRLSAAKQGLVRTEAGDSLAAPHPLLMHRQLHMPVLVWPCHPEADYLSLLSLIADSSWKDQEK